MTSSNRRQIAGSRSSPWFVAAIRMLLGGQSSISCKSTFTNRLSSPMSASSPRLFAMASNSSNSSTEGMPFAYSRTARRLLPVFPRKLLITVARSKTIKGSPSSAAIQRALIVLPTPGGPTKSNERVGTRPRCWSFEISRRSAMTCEKRSFMPASNSGALVRWTGNSCRTRARRLSASTGAIDPPTSRSGAFADGLVARRRTSSSAKSLSSFLIRGTDFRTVAITS